MLMATLGTTLIRYGTMSKASQSARKCFHLFKTFEEADRFLAALNDRVSSTLYHGWMGGHGVGSRRALTGSDVLRDAAEAAAMEEERSDGQGSSDGTWLQTGVAKELDDFRRVHGG